MFRTDRKMKNTVKKKNWRKFFICNRSKNLNLDLKTRSKFPGGWSLNMFFLCSHWNARTFDMTLLE